MSSTENKNTEASMKVNTTVWCVKLYVFVG